MLVENLVRGVGAAPGLLGWLEREVGTLAGRLAAEPDRMMRCEEYRDDGQVVVRAELPGIDPAVGLEVTITGGLLRIRARRREQHHPGRTACRSEFFYGEMVRTLALPAGVDEAAARARYADGILEVVVPLDGRPGPSTVVVPVAGAPG